MVAGCTTRGGSPDTCRWLAPIVSSAVDPHGSLRLCPSSRCRPLNGNSVLEPFPKPRHYWASTPAHRPGWQRRGDGLLVFLKDPKHFLGRAEEAPPPAGSLLLPLT